MLSDDDEHDQLVNDINAKALLRPSTAATQSYNPHSPYPLPFHPTSPFPLSTSLPLPPPPPPASSHTDSDTDIDVDEQYLYLHKLDRKALTLLCSPPPSDAAGDVSTSEAAFGALQLAVQLMFHSLDCKRTLYGTDSIVCLSHAELLIQLLNRTAMTCVQQLQAAYGKDNSSIVDEREKRRDVKRLRTAFRSLPLSWLKQAEQLCVAYPQLLTCHVLTLNHLACCYRLVNKPRTAIRLLQEAQRRATETDDEQQQTEEESEEALTESNETSGAASRLYMRAVLNANLCAVLCQMECWEQAGLHAKLAVDLCQQHALVLTRALSADAENTAVLRSKLSDALSLLSHCYGAVGAVELELHVPSCLHWFEKAQAVEESTQAMEEERRAVNERWADVFANVKQAMDEKEAERRRESEMMRVHRPWKVVSKVGFSRPMSRLSHVE